MNPLDTSSLSTHQKLVLVEQLWDEIAAETAAHPLPERVDRFAQERRDDHAKRPESAVSHDEVWRRIEGRRG